MKAEKSKTLKTALVFAAVLAVVVVVLLLMNIPAERQQETKVETLEMNSYDPAEVNSSDLRETITSSVLVRRYIEKNDLSSLWAAVEKEGDVNLLIVYNVPTSDFVWKEVSRKMPEGVRSPYSPALIKFTKDALSKGACVANITNVQGEVAVCVGVDKKAALNAIMEYAKKNMKCIEDSNCAVNAINNALEEDASSTIILYVGLNGNVLRVFEPKKNTVIVWYEGRLSTKGGV